MIPLPIRDDHQRIGAPAITVLIILLNCGAWLLELSHGVALSTLDYGLIPSFFLHHTRHGFIELPQLGQVELRQEVPVRLTLFTSMFLHGCWLHIIGNLWFLWVFGDRVEQSMGRFRYLVFYLACGVAAGLTQIFSTPDSTLPMVGASGAIAGVLGAYLILFPRARVRCLWVLIVFITSIWLPAWLLLGVWFVSQFFVPGEAGVASMAHVGGFVAGMLLAKLFEKRPAPPPRRWAN
jgi:membrane associated rhomboid family serine protease